MPLLFNREPPPDGKLVKAFVVLTLVAAAVVVLGQMFR
jgi:hypothetical protein